MLTWCLPQLVGTAHAKDFLMTSRPVLAQEAREAGLLNKVVVRDRLVDGALEMAHMIAANPPSGPRNVKALIDVSHTRGLRERWVAEKDMLLAQEVAGDENPTRAMAGKLKARPVSQGGES